MYLFLSVLDHHCCFLLSQQAEAPPRLWGVGFSLQWLLSLQSEGQSTWASVVAARGLSRCGALAQLPHNMRNLPRPEIEPPSSALAGGLLTTGPPGQSGPYFFFFFLTARFQVICIEFLLGILWVPAYFRFRWLLNSTGHSCILLLIMASAPFAVSFENTHYIKDEILLIYVIAPLSLYSLPDSFLLCTRRVFTTA